MLCRRLPSLEVASESRKRGDHHPPPVHARGRTGEQGDSLLPFCARARTSEDAIIAPFPKGGRETGRPSSPPLSLPFLSPPFPSLLRVSPRYAGRDVAPLRALRKERVIFSQTTFFSLPPLHLLPSLSFLTRQPKGGSCSASDQGRMQRDRG